MSKTKKHEWLRIGSARQPYTLDDISVIIPSAAHRYEERWKWFWPQYVKNTHPTVVGNTYIPCDEQEEGQLRKLTGVNIIVTSPRFIVYKTLRALKEITTRLTFRLANDIMVVREGWEQPLLKRFNSQKKLQLISEVQHGVTYPASQHAMQKDWDFIRRQYPKDTTAAVYPQGSRLFAQTSIWNGYYSHVLRYTPHDHDEIFFSQIANGEIMFTHFSGISAYLAHVGLPLQDFNEKYIKEIEEKRKGFIKLPDKTGFRVICA